MIQWTGWRNTDGCSKSSVGICRVMWSVFTKGNYIFGKPESSKENIK